MKKFVLVLAIALVGLTYGAQAQYESGQVDANIGVGLGSTFATGTLDMPPVSLALDFGLSDKMSLGAYVGYSASKEDFSGFGANYSWKYTYIIVGARGAYHFDLVDQLDTYAGVLLGYNVASVTYEGSGTAPTSPSAGGLAYAGFAGARYHFGDTFGVYAELGYGLALLNAGLTLKF
ncbi:MAG: porin family protein [Bacteroidetes bacterium]|nr:porin family protein [Bacteroidota bacterium]MBU1578509.1 porin family protein [Bacteroidota bacterium]MBU2559039.1 porin family protein [Bacteroidota bacterium]